ncbi:SiaB family protein kinase [Alkalitalea saponilacus]|uniref:Histidine kinase-, DNA gyrase B-, and HSP90-like ATPase n=1 Tax=Alkalitalea saponilacus TaxID=889453 RepID=A0A1T5HA39_9BACT|nr:SiaB family protein kinase [Alkalitalea saponilacus]ASB50806.1 hypothetical protein CDL62_17420 [Alkalitalea saponilacus]SKC17542.1 hypothetical protein SAMN03080601_02174 [Alkalitalea saponilacus]
MGFDLDKWIAQKMQGEVILKYVGDVSSDKITDALDSIESYLNLKNEKNKTRKKVYNVFVECIQNLFHHVDIPPVTAKVDLVPKFGVIILARDNSFYRISTGNFVLIDKISIIKDRIDQVNSLSDEEVRSIYRDILGNEEITLKGGGGLGMLDIVRKTGNKLEYMLYPHDNEYLFFSLDVYIS